VLDPGTEDFKPSAKKYLEKADAVVMHENGTPEWRQVTLGDISNRPIFNIVPPPYVNADLIEFVAQKLKVKSGSLV
jgi:hypothetical protein